MFFLRSCCAVQVEQESQKEHPEVGPLPSVTTSPGRPDEAKIDSVKAGDVPVQVVASSVLTDSPYPQGSVIPAAAAVSTESKKVIIQDDLMPFRKKGRIDSKLKKQRYDSMKTNTNNEEDGEMAMTARKSINCLTQFLNGAPVTKDNITVGLSVVRGPDWGYGEEDGGSGKGGNILAVDTEKWTVTVAWQSTSHVGTQYRFGAKCDLLVAQREQVVDVDDGFTFGKRDSQFMFADKTQTIIVFDWDDTLFPTHYVRDELELEYNKPMKDQPINSKYKAQINRNLAKCEAHVLDLLRLASKLGKVILVTLARNPWVSMSCNNFYPKCHALIEQMKVPIVYAQTGIAVDYDKISMASNDEIEAYWSDIKGKAIAREVKRFYSQYEGQSWKNIISIGDSDFERLGTQSATADYMRDLKGVPNQNQVIKVRTKTFKLVDQPSIEELTVEVAMLKKWLPLMVNLDTSFDVNLENVEDAAMLQRIETTLRGTGG